jgi:hypothetical protein
MAKPIKRLPQSVRNRAQKLLPAAILAFLAIPPLQKAIDPTARLMQNSEAVTKISGSGVGNEFLLLPLLGFREAAAGLLWVRTDEFFHSGDYDAILPLVRLITWLDPHADNIFITGAWHLAYNFTDSSERSDRRYIAPAQALLDEGIANNPEIPDILFEKGWQNYDKIKDYVAAEQAFYKGMVGPRGDGKTRLPKDQTTDWPYFAPLKTFHILAHTYAKRGRITDALNQWQISMKRCDEQIKADKTDYANLSLREAETRNFNQTMQRWRDRYTETGHDPKVNNSRYPNVLNPGASSDKTPRPWDVAFQPHIEIKRPKVFRIYGRFVSADGPRIDVRITDWDYKERPVNPAENTFKVDDDATILVDAISVRKAKFERELDMSKDPRMYSFKSPYYKIVLSFNPRSTSPHIQDRFGYSGEGLTDRRKEFVYVDNREHLRGTKMIEGQSGEGAVWDGKTIPWTEYGQPLRMIRVVYKVSREQIMGNKPITDADIVPNEQAPPQ